MIITQVIIIFKEKTHYDIFEQFQFALSRNIPVIQLVWLAICNLWQLILFRDSLIVLNMCISAAIQLTKHEEQTLQ
jgi:hypothetical protein